jgi:hypothetical protein
LFDAFGSASAPGLDAWTISGKGQVRLDEGKLVITAADPDANPVLTSKTAFAFAGREKLALVIRDALHAVNYNHATGGLDIGLGDALTVRLTTWGDGSGVLAGGKLFAFKTPPVATNNVSLELTFDNATRRLVVRQFGGSAKSAGQWKPTGPNAPLVILDELLDSPLALPDPVSLTIRVRSQYNGGTAAKGTTIGGLRLEAN